MQRTLAVLALGVASSCAAPLAVHREDFVLGEVASRYHHFYPADGDPDPQRDAGLLRPRFGIPAIAQTGAAFTVELLERGAVAEARAALLAPDVSDADAERCLQGEVVDGCHPLTLVPGESRAVGAARVVQATAQPRDVPPPGGYDLYLHPCCDAPTRSPRAVWMRADDPARLAEVRVAQLSDIHIGKRRDELEAHLRQVIDEVNQEKPDLVLITGDIVNQGRDASLPPRAQKLLLGLAAPVAIVLGNHDIGFRSFVGEHYGDGWENFARAFHPYLEFELALGGYRFVGFDSGPSTLSPRILTRGLSPETIAHLARVVLSAASERGVVLFSHAPSRAVLGGETTSAGAFGHMRDGHKALERMMLDAAARGQRVLHLSGHTHWSDLFEARSDGGELHFVRWPDGELPRTLTPVHGKALLITTQAATHAGPWPKASARGYGFTLLVLGDGDARVAFHRHDPPADVRAVAAEASARRDSRE
jgi:predicted MPP superfamily phosphohydrolase